MRRRRKIINVERAVKLAERIEPATTLERIKKGKTFWNTDFDKWFRRHVFSGRRHLEALFGEIRLIMALYYWPDLKERAADPFARKIALLQEEKLKKNLAPKVFVFLERQIKRGRAASMQQAIALLEKDLKTIETRTKLADKEIFKKWGTNYDKYHRARHKGLSMRGYMLSSSEAIRNCLAEIKKQQLKGSR